MATISTVGLFAYFSEILSKLQPSMRLIQGVTGDAKGNIIGIIVRDNKYLLKIQKCKAAERKGKAGGGGRWGQHAD